MVSLLVPDCVSSVIVSLIVSLLVPDCVSSVMVSLLVPDCGQ